MIRRARWLGCFGLSCAITSGAWAAQPLAAAAAPPEPPVAAEAAPSSAQSPSSTTSDTGDRADSRRLGRMWGWILVGGLGGTAGLVAIGTSVVMLIDEGTRSSNCNAAKVCSASGLSANSDLATLGGWNVGAWALTAVGLGVGAYLVVTNPADHKGDTQVGVVPNGSGATVSLRTAF